MRVRKKKPRFPYRFFTVDSSSFVRVPSYFSIIAKSVDGGRDRRILPPSPVFGITRINASFKRARDRPSDSRGRNEELKVARLAANIPPRPDDYLKNRFRSRTDDSEKPGARDSRSFVSVPSRSFNKAVLICKTIAKVGDAQLCFYTVPNRKQMRVLAFSEFFRLRRGFFRCSVRQRFGDDFSFSEPLTKSGKKNGKQKKKKQFFSPFSLRINLLGSHCDVITYSSIRNSFHNYNFN